MNRSRGLTGRIFDIERFGLVDGPGIRTVVFFKGCPLRCQWCHNPESQSISFEIMFSEERCVRCGACKEACPNDAIHFDAELNSRGYLREKCALCGRCIEVCQTKALERVGYEVEIDSLMKEVLGGMPFYRRSGGGVTLSGGEPLLQVDFCKELLKACHEEGIHTSLDTSGYVGWEDLCQTLDNTGLFLYDIKHMDEKKHREGTGVSNAVILENLKKLVSARHHYSFEITIRIPVIPGFNANRGEIEEILLFVKDLRQIENVEILPFHHYGKMKYKKLGRDYLREKDKALPREFLEEMVSKGRREGLNVFLGD